jgi:hypothetical protein
MKRVPCLSQLASYALLVVLAVPGGAVVARDRGDCAPAEPDSVQISWEAPCESGEWLFEPGVGCRMWDWHPAAEDRVTWTGRCNDGAKSGYGRVQWYEHGRPIDRFEGTFAAGRRQGAGRYTWNEDNWYVGLYQDDVPNGLGTAYIGGETFSGQWHAGCFRARTRTVAIGVPRKSCDDPDLSPDLMSQSASRQAR